MRYSNESYKEWVVRMLQEIAGTLDVEKYEHIEHISAINYTIGYLIGIGWADQGRKITVKGEMRNEQIY